jgi:predicted permease
MAAVLTLGVGITLSTLAMAVLNAYLLTGMPYPAADRLYWIRYAAAAQDQPRGLEALDWRSLDDVVEHPVAWDLDMFYLLGGTHAESAPGAWVTRGFMQALGFQPAIGSGFDEAAFAPGGENVALISHRLWTSRFGADPAIVGQTFAAYVSDRPDEAERFRIVGVLPQDFWHVNPYTDVIVPLRVPTYPYMARLREGVTPAAAASRIAGLVRAGATGVREGWAPTLVSVHDAHVAPLRPILRATSGAAALVLLVACANVAGLLLVRATRRQREIAVRAALGAGRAALARMLLAEGLLIGAAATTLAVVATRVTLGALAPMVQQQMGRSAPGGVPSFAVDWRVIAFAAAIGMTTAILCTVVPLGTALRKQVLGGLQNGGRGATEGRRSRRARSMLIAAEIAMSLVLLVGSAMMLRSVVMLLRADLGFTADRVLLSSLTLRQNRYPDTAARAAVFERIAERIGAIPGVESVGLTTAWPLQQPSLVPVRRADRSDATPVSAALHGITENYLHTLGIRLVGGRAFQSLDREGSEPVALVSDSLARRLWPDGNGVGSRLAVPQRQERGEPIIVSRLIVGVVGDVLQSPADAELADVYVPMRQAPTRFTFILARTAGGPAGAVPQIRTALHDIDPEFVAHRARPLQDVRDETTAGARFMTSLLSAFALAAAALALIGVYGVIAYAVRQREREIAVRLAIGADPSRIVRLFVRQGAVVLAAGLALGVVATLPAGRLIESQLFGVTPRDPVAIALAVVAFGAAGLLAVWWPARRAAATAPAIALRCE